MQKSEQQRSWAEARNLPRAKRQAQKENFQFDADPDSGSWVVFLLLSSKFIPWLFQRPFSTPLVFNKKQQKTKPDLKKSWKCGRWKAWIRKNSLGKFLWNVFGSFLVFLWRWRLRDCDTTRWFSLNKHCLNLSELRASSEDLRFSGKFGKLRETRNAMLMQQNVNKITHRDEDKESKE